jgi:hypothetical protein
MNNSLKQELGLSREQFEAKETENVYLKESVGTMDKDLQEARNTNDNLSHQIESSENLFMKKKTELLIFRFHPLVKHCWKIRRMSLLGFAQDFKMRIPQRTRRLKK